MKSSRKIVILISLFTILISLTACGTNDKYGNGRTSKAEYNFDENIASIVVDDVELPDNPKQIMYKYSYLNYAWGCVDYGNIVCADGSVYTYDFSDYEYYESKSTAKDPISDYEFITKYADPICVLDEKTVKTLYALIQKIDLNEKFEAERDAIDAGSRSLNVSPDGETIYIIKDEGDFEGELKGEAAQTAIYYIEENVNPQIKSLREENEEQPIYITPAHSDIVTVETDDWNKPSEEKRFLIQGIDDAKRLGEMYGIDLTQYYNFEPVEYEDCVRYIAVLSPNSNKRIEGFKLVAFDFTPCYDDITDSNSDCGSIVLTEIPKNQLIMKDMIKFYEGWSRVTEFFPEGTDLEENVTALAQKFADENGLTFDADNHFLTKSYINYYFTEKDGEKLSKGINLHILFDKDNYEIIGAYDSDEDNENVPSEVPFIVYDADGSEILRADSTNEFAISPTNDVDNLILYKGQDIRELDALKDNIVMFDDIKDLDSFKETIDVADGEWFSVELYQNLYKYGDNNKEVEYFLSFTITPEYENSDTHFIFYAFDCDPQ